MRSDFSAGLSQLPHSTKAPHQQIRQGRVPVAISLMPPTTDRKQRLWLWSISFVFFKNKPFVNKNKVRMWSKNLSGHSTCSCVINLKTDSVALLPTTAFVLVFSPSEIQAGTGRRADTVFQSAKCAALHAQRCVIPTASLCWKCQDVTVVFKLD